MCLNASACPVNQPGLCGDVDLSGDVGTLDWLHWVGQEAATKDSGGLIQCARGTEPCPCTTTGATPYDTSPTSFTWSDGSSTLNESLKSGSKDLHGISYKALDTFVTIPPSSRDIAVRVYAGISDNEPAEFSAVLKDHTGAELATTTYSYTRKAASFVDVVWLVTVPPPPSQQGGDTSAAPPRTLELVWAANGAQLQAVAVSHNTTQSSSGGWADPEMRAGRVAAAQPFVILQAAAVSQH